MPLSDTFKRELEEFHKEYKEHEYIFQHNASIQHWRNVASQYAQMGIKHCAWLNGGSLVALPAIIKAFELQNMHNEILSAASFAGGLFFVMVCLIFAYFSVCAAVGFSENDRNHDYIQFSLRHIEYSIETTNKLQKELETYRALKNRCDKAAIILEYFAIFFYALSVAGFISGCYFLLDITL